MEQPKKKLTLAQQLGISQQQLEDLTRGKGILTQQQAAILDSYIAEFAPKRSNHRRRNNK